MYRLIFEGHDESRLFGAKTVTAAIAIGPGATACGGSTASSRTCSATIAVPPGAYTLVVTTYDAAPVAGAIPGSAHELATGTVTNVTVAAGQSNATTVYVGGLVAGFGAPAFISLSGNGQPQQVGFALTPIDSVGEPLGLVGPDERLYTGTPLGNPAAYGASKAGLTQLTRRFATTLAPAVRCNAVTPGGVLRGQAAEFQSRYVDRVPLGRMAVEEDFKCAVAFLASDASAYVTGQNIIVDGDWTAW